MTRSELIETLANRFPQLVKADADMAVDFQAETTPDDVVTVIATDPLTANEDWQLYRPGQWLLWRRGEQVAAGALAD